MSLSATVQALYTATFNNLTANGSEPPPNFVYPWVSKERFVRVPVYNDGYMSFAAATAMVRKDGKISVYNFGVLEIYTDVNQAAQFLTEV